MPCSSIWVSFQRSSRVHGRMLILMEFVFIFHVWIVMSFKQDFTIKFILQLRWLNKFILQVDTQLVACFSLLLRRSFLNQKSPGGLWQLYLEGVGKTWRCICRGKLFNSLVNIDHFIVVSPKFLVNSGVLECSGIVIAGICARSCCCLWGPSEDLSEPFDRSSKDTLPLLWDV